MMKIYSVTEINNYIKLLLLKDNVLSCVKISGEVSNCKYHSSGHIYFTLKDSTGQIACVMFAGKRIAGLKFNMTEGMSVVVTGQISVYERDGKYQLYAERIEQQGIGELYERFEKLKEKLMKEGLFDNEHKKPLPPYISTLGVITAPDGAAVQDIINITHRRNPHVKIIIYPAKVQGAGAAKTLIAGIKAME
ncbi:MAG: exodeoxyribonuclease VII large subunit, partial [Lachnospiraceae bacterium]|nr:exodeoxyribonuclease VII large subunit [Lachnospiraceae bacterium]